MVGGSTRVYDNTRRRAAADATRHSVIIAAGETFAEQGYAATTLSEVADAAGVSVETIKKRFGTKRGLLTAWFDSAVAGDEGVAVADSGWVEELASVDTFAARVDRAAEAVAATHRRAATALRVVAAAAHADPDIADWWADERKRRHHDVATIVPLVLGDVEPATPLDQLVDSIYALSEAHTFLVLTDELGWPDDRYRRWFATQIIQAASTSFDDPES